MLLFVMVFQYDGMAQEYLYLKKKGTARIKEFHVYTHVKIQLDTGTTFLEGQVTRYSQYGFILDEALKIPYDRIKVLKIDQRGKKNAGKTLMIAGAIYAGIITLNPGSQEAKNRHYVAAGSLFALGTLFRFNHFKTYDMEKYRFEYINMSDVED